MQLDEPGRRVAPHMRTPMVVDPIEMARWSGGKVLEGAMSLRCRVSVYVHSVWRITSIRYGERLAEIGAVPSIGTVGDSLDTLGGGVL